VNKESKVNKEKFSNSFINKGVSISDISFNANTSTGIKGIQYLRSSKKYRVVWKGYYIAYLKDFDKAREVLINYLDATCQRDKYAENLSQIKNHLGLHSDDFGRQIK